MMFVPAPNYHETWANAWKAIKALPNLRTIEFSRESSRLRVDHLSYRDITQSNMMDLESIAASNSRLQFYFVVWDFAGGITGPWLPGLNLSPGTMGLKTVVRHLAPFNIDTVREAFAELESVWNLD
jgi:hypothetical protein